MYKFIYSKILSLLKFQSTFQFQMHLQLLKPKTLIQNQMYLVMSHQVIKSVLIITCQQKLIDLRAVPTKYKGFCARLGPCGKSRPLHGLLESTKKNGGSHAFFF